MTAPSPREPGYYWAKLITPNYGTFSGEDWTSADWEIVQLNDNNGEGREEFSVSVHGIPITQWPDSFEWGPRLHEQEYRP